MIRTRLMYSVAVCLIWGSTWLAMKYQQGIVPIEQSVLYRFILAFLILGGIFAKTKIKSAYTYTLQDHGFMILLGACNFSLNYLLAYHGTTYLKTGVVAVVFSLIFFFNMINTRLLLKRPTSTLLIFGGSIGVIGVFLIFGSEFWLLEYDTNLLIGLFIGLLGAYITSLGNVIVERNAHAHLPHERTTLWSMGYGMGFLALYTFLLGKPLTFEWSQTYIVSMAYLVVFGTILAFFFYFSLIRMQGATATGLSVLFIPVVAMILSSIGEGFHWGLITYIGILFILIGNYLVLTKGKFIC